MFGIDVIDAALLPAMLVALIAGVISFLSPCVLPIVPPYLAYMAGVSMEDVESGKNRKVIVAALFFVLGLSTVFIMMGIAASALGRSILQYQGAMTIIGGIIVMIFGLHFLDIIRIPFLYREARIEASNRGGSIIGAYILGVAFAFGWTPCIGPILGAILFLVVEEGSISKGIFMMAAYAIGLGLPFLLSAVFIRRSMVLMNRFKKHMGRIERISGVLLWTIGLMMLTGSFSDLAYWLQVQFPSLAAIG
ncbi:MAG: cytochrome c biogenesis protein CcdA [Rhodobacteraceae bacterium]|nr:cytochrome c biogenesis protein CcdA [Paracoccaceae bacterium]